MRLWPVLLQVPSQLRARLRLFTGWSGSEMSLSVGSPSTATTALYKDVEATLEHCEGFVAQFRSLQVAIIQLLDDQAVLVKLCVETVVLRTEEPTAEEAFLKYRRECACA